MEECPSKLSISHDANDHDQLTLIILEIIPLDLTCISFGHQVEDSADKAPGHQ